MGRSQHHLHDEGAGTLPESTPNSLAELLALIDTWCSRNLGRRPVEVGFRWRDSTRPSWWPMPDVPPAVTPLPASGRDPPPAAGPHTTPGPTPAPADYPRHSPDYRSVHWFGCDYTFTPTQAAVIRQLWEAWEDGTPGVGQETLLEGAGSTGDRLRDVFRGSPAWGTLVVALGKGLFALAPQG
jgi:hypothetical protein